MNAPNAAMTQLGSSQIFQNGFWEAASRMELEAADREKAQNNIAFIERLLDDYDNAISAINKNGDLSSQGRVKSVLDTSTRYLKKLDDQTSAVLAGLAETIRSSTSSLAQASRGAEATTVSELRAQEVRVWFSGLVDILRPQEYEKLISAGNVMAARAIEDAPIPLLPADVIAGGQATRAATNLPDVAYAKTAAETVSDLLTTSLRFAKKHLTLAPTNDPLLLAAAGAYPIDETE
jgi:hypothetical protein